jgi:hypothetical protein
MSQLSTPETFSRNPQNIAMTNSSSVNFEKDEVIKLVTS